MDRKDFIKSCTYACLSGVALTTLIASCTSTKHLDVLISDSDVVVNESEFEIVKKGVKSYRKYIILQNDQLKFPICLYKNDSSYTAIFLECTHQGAELQVYGEKIVCPAHGSEFNNTGGVENGPAAEALRTFPTKLHDGRIIISLKA